MPSGRTYGCIIHCRRYLYRITFGVLDYDCVWGNSDYSDLFPIATFSFQNEMYRPVPGLFQDENG